MVLLTLALCNQPCFITPPFWEHKEDESWKKSENRRWNSGQPAISTNNWGSTNEALPHFPKYQCAPPPPSMERPNSTWNHHLQNERLCAMHTVRHSIFTESYGLSSGKVFCIMQTVKLHHRMSQTSGPSVPRGICQAEGPTWITTTRPVWEKQLHKRGPQVGKHVYIQITAHFAWFFFFLNSIWKCNHLKKNFKTFISLNVGPQIIQKQFSASSFLRDISLSRRELEEINAVAPNFTSSLSQSSSISNTWLGIFSGRRDLLKMQESCLRHWAEQTKRNTSEMSRLLSFPTKTMPRHRRSNSLLFAKLSFTLPFVKGLPRVQPAAKT